MRIGNIIGRPLRIAPLECVDPPYLVLGYEDDDYSDNGYWGHDDGTGNQCRGVGPAWVTLAIEHQLPPGPSFSCGPYTLTYRADALDGRTGVGIRCVKVSDGRTAFSHIPKLAWYGEGSGTDKHIDTLDMPSTKALISSDRLQTFTVTGKTSTTPFQEPSRFN